MPLRVLSDSREPPPQGGPLLAQWEIRLAIFLSIIAGMVDVIGFLSLGKLFAAHITGNIVMISAAHIYQANIAQILAVPIFIIAVAAVWFIAKASRKEGPELARLLLTVQFILLAVLLTFCVITRPEAARDNVITGIAAMLAVSAMACQHSLLRLCIPKAPSTAVMTGNVTSTVISLFDSMARTGPLTEGARERLSNSLGALFGFIAGCVSGAVAVGWYDDWSWALPAILAGLTVILLPNRIDTHASR